MRRVVVLLAIAACSRSPSPSPDDAAPSTVSASDPIAAKAEVDDPSGVWPAVPRGSTPSGATWRTIRHGTVHVHVAVPAGAEVELSTLQYGHPVVRVGAGKSTVDIVYSSGTSPFNPGLAADPPTIAGLPLERIARTDENTTILYRKHGSLVVKGWVRGAVCDGEYVAPEDLDAAFEVCASVRVPPPGPLSAMAGSTSPRPAVPANAVVQEEHGVPMIYAGHFVARVVARACPTEAELREDLGETVVFETRQLEHGAVLVGLLSDTYEGTTFRTDTTVWATRAEHCCLATILGFFTPPTNDQIDAIATMCDATG